MAFHLRLRHRPTERNTLGKRLSRMTSALDPIIGDQACGGTAAIDNMRYDTKASVGLIHEFRE